MRILEVSMGGRFGKYGDAKRKAQIHHGGTGEKKLSPKNYARPAPTSILILP